MGGGGERGKISTLCKKILQMERVEDSTFWSPKLFFFKEKEKRKKKHIPHPPPKS